MKEKKYRPSYTAGLPEKESSKTSLSGRCQVVGAIAKVHCQRYESTKPGNRVMMDETDSHRPNYKQIYRKLHFKLLELKNSNIVS